METENKQRMYSIVLKKEDKNGNSLSIEADSISPIFPFGKDYPMLKCFIDDHAYFIQLSEMAWFEQNYGVKNDEKIANEMMQEKMKTDKNKSDVSFI